MKLDTQNSIKFFISYFKINFRRRRKRRDAEKNSDRPVDFNLPNIPHQTPVQNDDPLVSKFRNSKEAIFSQKK